MRIFINPGHGGSDPGAIGNGLKEKDIVLKIAKRIYNELRTYKGVTVKLFRSTDKFYTLREITNQANNWKADIFISIHVNAGGGIGFESFIFDGSIQTKTRSNQNTIHQEIMKAVRNYNIVDRGKKRANYHVLRETNMPAILTEVLFIDNKSDAKLLKRDSFIKDVANGHINGIVKATRIVKNKPSSNSATYYRVVTGSFKEKANANKQISELNKKGFDSFLDYTGKTYRVITGSFKDKLNAQTRMQTLKKQGFDSFIHITKK